MSLGNSLFLKHEALVQVHCPSHFADAFEAACIKHVFAEALAAGKVEEADRDSEVHRALMNMGTFFSPEFLINEGMPMSI